MKRTVTIVVLMVWLANCTPTLSTRKYHQYERGYQITISERAGENFDADERARYGLFKGVEYFESARFYSVFGGGYEVVIKTTNGTFMAVNRDSRAVEILRDYIDGYATDVSSPKIFEKKWDIVDYDDIGFPITKSEIRKYVSPTASCACGAGSAAAIIGGSLLLGALSIMGGGILSPVTPEEERRANIILGAGIFTGIAVGLMVHHWQNTNNMSRALEFIKDARRMQVVSDMEK